MILKALVESVNAKAQSARGFCKALCNDIMHQRVEGRNGDLVSVDNPRYSYLRVRQIPQDRFEHRWIGTTIVFPLWEFVARGK